MFYNIEPDKTKSLSDCDFLKSVICVRGGHRCGYQNANLHHCICLPTCLKLPVVSYLCMPYWLYFLHTCSNTAVEDFRSDVTNISLYSFVLKVLLEVTLDLADYFVTVNEEETVTYMFIWQVSHHDDLNPSETAYVCCYRHWHWVKSVGETVAQDRRKWWGWGLDKGS